MMDILTHTLQAMADKVDFGYIEVWMEDYIDIPVIATMLYLVLVLYVPQHVMQDRAPLNLRGVNLKWNLFLTVFSFIGAYYCVPRLYEVLTADVISGISPAGLARFVGAQPGGKPSAALLRHAAYAPTSSCGGGADGDALSAAFPMPVGISGSFDTSVCVWYPEIYRRGVVGLLCLAFALSKIPEMFDTVLLVLQKKKYPFLHWYHHITVMLYCWHAFIVPTPAGVWFATMNFVVHAIMYFYYFLTSCGLTKRLRPFAPVITFLQIAQMAVGTYISFYSFAVYLFGDGCDWTPSNMKLCFLMYSSYAYLFIDFFVKRYMAKPKAAAAAVKAAA